MFISQVGLAIINLNLYGIFCNSNNSYVKMIFFFFFRNVPKLCRNALSALKISSRRDVFLLLLLWLLLFFVVVFLCFFLLLLLLLF